MVRWFFKNTPFANVLTTLFVVLGLVAFSRLPREEYREIKFFRVLVITVYRGASAEEVEKLVTNPIEEELEDVSDVRQIVSKSYEGRSVIKVDFEDYLDDAAYQVRVQDVRAAAQQARLPGEVEDDPFVFEAKTTSIFPLISVVLAGDLSERRMKDLAEDLQDRIEALKGVDRTFVGGIRDRQIWIAVDAARLSALGLSLSQVSEAVGASNLDLPAGSLKLGRTEYLVRTAGEADDPFQLEDVIVSSTSEGQAVRIRDVGRVLDTFEPLKTVSRHDGKPSINLGVYITGDANSIALVEQITEIVKEFREAAPPSVSFDLVGDSTERIRDRLQVLQDNIFLGFFLLVVILYFFLGLRNAMIVAFGVPISLLVTFFLMDQYGETLNSQSLFGIVLVLGMLVDDALVVVENIHRHAQMGKSMGEAAYEGTREVLVPVLTSSLTTCAAFLPLALLSGVIGQFMRIVPIVVAVALAASLFECFFLLPGHAAEWGDAEEEGHPKVTTWFDRATERYERGLRWVLARRYKVVGFTALILVSATVLILQVKKNLWENDAFSMFFVRIWAPEGTRIEETDKLVRAFEQEALALPKEEVAAVLSETGALRTETEFLFKSNVGQVTVELQRDPDRRDADEIIEQLRAATQNIPGIETVVFAKRSSGPPAGADVEVLAQYDYLDGLDAISREIMAELQSYGGVADIQRDLEMGKQEIVVDLDKKLAAQYGLTTGLVARYLRNAIYGEIASEFREGNDEIDIIVKYEGGDELSLPELRDLRIPTPRGGFVPVSQIAQVTVKPVVATLNHYDLKRTVLVSAEIDQEKGTTQSVNERVMQFTRELQKKYPGLSFRFEGEFAELQKALRNIGGLFLLGLFLMYAILVAEFRSLVVPLVVLFTVPMAALGVLVILLLTNISFSLTTIFGIVALSGVVVNDSIVMVSFMEERRRAGDSPEERDESIIEGCKIRLRPIFLTTATTLMGMLPMAVGLAGKSVVWGNMAKTISAGLGGASFLAIFIIPSLYAIVDDLARRAASRKAGAPAPEERPTRLSKDGASNEAPAAHGGATVFRLDAPGGKSPKH